MVQRMTEEEVIIRDRKAPCYDYYKPLKGEIYRGLKAKRRHFCEKCGAESLLAPEYFWKGSGCQSCSSKRGQGQQFENAEVNARDREALCYVSYPPDQNQVYVSQYKKRNHTCQACGHHGQLSAKSFWSGTGCPSCADSGFDKSLPAILYYLRIERSGESPLYKVGITNRTVQDRFNNKDLCLVFVVKEWSFELGSDAYREEQRLIKANKQHKYTGDRVLESGNNELFTRDILGLDKNLEV